MKTAREIANEAITENRPFDYNWLRHVRKTYSQKELHEFGVRNIEPFLEGTESKQLIGRAANILVDEVMAEVYWGWSILKLKRQLGKID